MILSRDVVNERILQSVGTRSATGHTKPKGLVSGANFLWWINSCRETKISLYSFQRNWWILQYKEYCNLIGWEVHLVTKSCSLKCSLTLMANYLHKKRNLQSNWTRDKIGHTQPKAVVSDTNFPFSLCPCKKKTLSFDSFLNIVDQRIWQPDWRRVTPDHTQLKTLVADVSFS